MSTDTTDTTNDIDSLLKQRRHRLEAMNERLALYKQKNQLMLEKEKELDRLAQEKYEQEQRQKKDKDRLEKERQELYAELQRQQQTRLPPTTPTSLTVSSSPYQQPTSSDNFSKVSEQEAIAWLKQQW